MNTKSFWILMAIVSLVVTAIGLVRFAVDLWNYFNTNTSSTSNVHLNYRGLGVVLTGIVMFVLFILLNRSKRS